MGARGYRANEEPMHEVVIPRGFWMMETPVTQQMWLGVMGGENPSFHKPGSGWEELPVERVKWRMAKEWCRGLELMMPLSEAQEWRVSLPMEAHWEYACRAGSVGEYCSGDGEERLREVGWFDGNSRGNTHLVKKKRPNTWGLYDIHGNVWEWCLDEWDASAYVKREDGWDVEMVEGGDEESPRVMRGGSCTDRALDCRSAYRGRWLPRHDDGDFGFRGCLFPGPPARAAGG